MPHPASPASHRLRRAGLLTVASAAALAAALPATAPAATTAQATSTSEAGMRYVGTDARNVVGVTRQGATFTIDDVVPVVAGAGCKAVPGDATKVTCTAFEVNGTFRRFEVHLGLGNDTVVNGTHHGNGGIAVAMLAVGGAGFDQLVGGESARDELSGGGDGDVVRGLGGSDLMRGGSGDDLLEGGTGFDDLDAGSGRNRLFGGPGDDQLDAGSGADTLDGGPDDDALDGGRGADVVEGGTDTSTTAANPLSGGDIVAYGGRPAAVTVDLRRADGHGEAGEGDRITGVEHVQGGSGADALTGDHRANVIMGNRGDDILLAEGGRDAVLGGEGTDIIAPSPMTGFFGVSRDGQPDQVDCDEDDTGLDNDISWRSPADGDTVKDCEQVVDL